MLDRGVGRVEQPRVAAHERLLGPVDGEVGLVPHLPGADRPRGDLGVLGPQRAAGPVARDQGRGERRVVARDRAATENGLARLRGGPRRRADDQGQHVDPARARPRAPCGR